MAVVHKTQTAVPSPNLKVKSQQQEHDGQPLAEASSSGRLILDECSTVAVFFNVRAAGASGDDVRGGKGGSPYPDVHCSGAHEAIMD